MKRTLWKSYEENEADDVERKDDKEMMMRQNEKSAEEVEIDLTMMLKISFI